uniref:T-complex protein 1 subunit theta n=1 Tax=Laticauda laticaudata TaxID=8630 RepID=A0A8C5RNF0_LATLA
MAAHIPMAPGLPQMLKAGMKYFSGLQESLFSNLMACKVLMQCLRTCYGPLGHNKLVINHLGKMFQSSHATTILKELELESPMACLLRSAVETQQEEMGDGTNFVVLLAGALLENAEKLLRSGVSMVHIRAGYNMACKEVLRLLPGLVCISLKNPHNQEEVQWVMQSIMGSKFFGYQKFLSKLVATACIKVAPPNHTAFNPEHIRVFKAPGGGILNSYVLEGMLIPTEAEGIIKRVERARIAVYCCPFGISRMEAKNTVMFESATQMKNFGKTEENLLTERVLGLVKAGVNVMVVGGRVESLALFYADRCRIMVVRLPSRMQLQQLCQMVGATLLYKPTVPSPEDIGHCYRVYTTEIGSTVVLVFSQHGTPCPLATVVLRGATGEMLDCLEAAIQDGVQVYKNLGTDARFLPGAGATEMALSVRLSTLGMYYPGCEQYGILEFSQALKTVLATLADNAGLPVNEIMAKMEIQHQLGNQNTGILLGVEEASTMDAAMEGILDPFLVKHRGIVLASQIAVTLLGVSDIMVAKKSGGPKPRGDNPNWDKEPDMLD